MIDCQDRVVHLDSARYHGGERELASITGIIAHATEGDSFDSSIEWLNREFEEDGITPLARAKHASYGYGIERDGAIKRMCAPTIIAYHSGDSALSPVHSPPGNGGHSVNAFTLGIAWANRGDGEELTAEQIESGLWLFRFWMDKLHIPPSRVLGHYEVSPGRKTDPLPAMQMGDWRTQLSEA